MKMIWYTLYAVTARIVSFSTEASRALEIQAAAAKQSATTETEYNKACDLWDKALEAREFQEIRAVQVIELGTSNEHEGLFVRHTDGEVSQQIGLMQFRANNQSALLRKLNAGRPLSVGTTNEVVRWFGTEAGAYFFLI